jgi:hypothetical protein
MESRRVSLTPRATMWLPWLRLHRAGRVRRWAHLRLTRPPQCPNRGSGTRDIRPRLLRRDDHGHCGAKPDARAFRLSAYYLTNLAFQASGAEPLAWGEFMERYTAMYPRGKPGLLDDPVTAYVDVLRASHTTPGSVTARREPQVLARDFTHECFVCVASASSSSNDAEPSPRHRATDAQRRVRLDELA